MWTEIALQIAQATGQPFQGQRYWSVSGGCINQGYSLTDGQQTYFVKLNQAAQLAMFEAEALGLQQMQATQTIRVPKPICWGIASGSAFLVLEWLDLGRADSQAWYHMGQQLAALHRVNQGSAYGWVQHNTIGSTPQINPWTQSWAEFFAEHRIGYQLKLANRQGGHFPQQVQLLEAIAQLLKGYQPFPSLVHGDLWSGNAAVTQEAEPVIFDPATYVGDREVDLAMTELFGRFPAEFYRGYDAVFPIDEGYKHRKTLYNLYHILNHFNLFGGSYQSQANQMIQQIIAQVI